MKCVFLIMDKIDCSSADAWSLKDTKALYNVFVRLCLGLCNLSPLRTNCSFPLGYVQGDMKRGSPGSAHKEQTSITAGSTHQLFVHLIPTQKWRCLKEEKLSLKLKGLCRGSQAMSIHAEAGQWSPRAWAATNSTNFFPGSIVFLIENREVLVSLMGHVPFIWRKLKLFQNLHLSRNICLGVGGGSNDKQVESLKKKIDFSPTKLRGITKPHSPLSYSAHTTYL